MKATLEVINRMQADGIIGQYAIGGAVGATFYLEPVATLDIDIFVSFQKVSAGGLISLSPVYDYLTTRGYKAKGEYMVVEGWPVQLLPSNSALSEEAIDQAIETELEAVRIRIMTAEHLTAIALQLGRSKDNARILQFVESGTLDADKFDGILKRHGLAGKWERFTEKFLRDD
jgi:hypothetical protein